MIKKLKELFLENTNIRQIIFKNTFWLILAEGSANLLKFFLLVFAARILGATGYGKFTFAFSFVTLFSIFFDLGLFNIIIREFAKDPKKEKYLSDLITLKIITSILAFGLIFISSIFLISDDLIKKTILILALYLFFGDFTNLFYAFFRSHQKMQYEAYPRILQAAITTGLGIIVIIKFNSILTLSYAYFIATFITLIGILIFFHIKFFPIRITFNKFIWVKFLKMSYYLALIGGLSTMIYNNLDSAMLGYFGQITQNGWYNSAYKIITLTLLPMSFIISGFYPALCASLKDSKEKTQKLWDSQMGIMIFLALPLSLGGIKLASKIINFLYTSEFIPAILAFQILSITAIFIYLYNNYNYILVVFNQQKKVFFTFLSAVILNIILNFILIPKFSLYGTALSSIITHSFIFFLLFGLTFKFTFIKPVNLKIFIIFIIALISSLIMYLALFFVNFNLFLSILFGILVYLFCFVILKTSVDKYVKIFKKTQI